MMMRILFVSMLAILLAPLDGFAENPGSTVPASSSGLMEGQRASAASSLVKVFDAKMGRERMVRAAEAAKIITEYWTPSRQAAAIPSSVTVAPGTTGERSLETPGVARDVARPALPKIRIAPNAVTFANAEGKAFFRDPRDGQDYKCSGGTVNSGKRRLVLTAGHCVHGGPGGNWMLNWRFEPGYQQGTGAAGAFPYYQLWGQSGWFNNGDRHYDYGIAITQNNANGQRVVDAVGGNGLTINPGYPFVTAIGYPSNFLGGETQSYCQVQLRASDSFQELNCNRLAGASGEPWLRDYNNANQLGYIVSDNSFRTHEGPPVYGPYFDSNTLALYQAAENASP